MNKKVAKVTVICLLMSLLTGCFPTGELEASSPNSVGEANSGTLSEPAAFVIPNDLKNVKFNFELNENYPSELPVIKAKMRTFDMEALKARFIDGKEIVKESSLDFGGVYHTSDGITLVVSQGRFRYIVEHYFDGEEEKRNVYSVQSNAATNLRYFYTEYHQLDSELEGFSRAEALARANSLVEEFDIKYLGEPSVYAFTLEDLEAVWGKPRFDKEGFEVDMHLSKDDEFYLVRYYGEYGGITMPGEIGQVFEDAFAYNTQVDIILTKDSLVTFECDNVFDSIEAIDTTQIKCGAETAVSKFHDYYGVKDNVMDYRLDYDSFGISYVTYERDYNTGEVIFKPLWHIAGRQYFTTNGISGDVFADKFVDPVTGMVYDTGV